MLRALGHQFGAGGTEALESEVLWEVPEIKRVGGLDALRPLGRPVGCEVREAEDEAVRGMSYVTRQAGRHCS